MTQVEKTLIEIAKIQDILYDYKRSEHVFVMIATDDLERLYRYRDTLKIGRVVETAGGVGSYKGDVRTTSLHWGQWRWNVEGYDAYLFCKAILPYLAKYNPFKHAYCQGVISTYESRQHQPTA